MSTKTIKLYLDDDFEFRPTPSGWTRAYTAQEAINILKTGKVSHLSLDHDLGPETAGTGYQVCCWMEELVCTQNDTSFIPTQITIHSANPVGRKNMQSSIDKIQRIIRTL